jgi:hypothetical protein
MSEIINRKRVFVELKVGQKTYNYTAGSDGSLPFREYDSDASLIAASPSAEVLQLIVTTGATATGTIYLTLRGHTPIGVAVTASDTASAVAGKIRSAASTFLPHWTVAGSSDTVTFTYKYTGIGEGTNLLNANGTGVASTAGFTVATPGVGSIAWGEYQAAITALETAKTGSTTHVLFPTNIGNYLIYNNMSFNTDDSTINIKKYTKIITSQVDSIELIEYPWRSIPIM